MNFLLFVFLFALDDPHVIVLLISFSNAHCLAWFAVQQYQLAYLLPASPVQ